jgi:exonuclease SbcC
MGFRLARLEAAGFRGINQPFDLALAEGLTVIAGGNGAGKSSLLQAVEWALFGTLPVGGQAEFRREDALVNAFSTASRALVRLTLTDGEQVMTLERTRRLGRSTTARSDLVVSSGGEVWRDPAGQEAITRLLGVSVAEFHSAVYLPQDASRSLASAEHEERSATIDRLLGIAALRDLAENLAISQVSREVNRLAQQLEAQRAGGLTTAVELRLLLTQREDALRDRQINAVQLSTRSLEDLLAQVAATFATGMTALGLPPATLPASRSARLAELRRLLPVFQRRREEAVRQVQEQRAQLAVALARLDPEQSVPAQDAALVPTAPEDLQEELANVEQRLSRARQREAQRQTLQREEAEISAAMAAAEQRLHSVQQSVGADSEVTLLRLQRELEALTSEGRRLRSRATLLNDALETLQGGLQDRCPVCDQPMNQATVLQHLQAEIASHQDARRLEELRRRYRGQDEQRRRRLEAQASLEAAQSEVAARRSSLAAVRTAWRAMLDDDAGSATLAALPAQPDSSPALEARRAELRDALRLQEQQHQVQRQRSAAQRAAAATLADLVSTPTGAAERDLSRLAGVRQADLAAELASLDQWGLQAVQLDSDLATATAIGDFLDLKANVERIEADRLGAEQHLTVLQTRHEQLLRLQTALQAIHAAALALSEERLQRALETVVPAANAYFDRLGGHPTYAALTLQPQMQRGSNIYALLAHDPELQHATFLPTRLSHTQMHVAALAVFLALGRQPQHHLAFRLLDDPAQSMDAGRQQALAAVLAAEARQGQIIVTTEDEAFGGALDSAANGVCTLVRLAGWDASGLHVVSVC